MLNVLIFGLGSIGRRHVKILREISDVAIYYFPSNLKTLDKKYVDENKINIVTILDESLVKILNFAIVSNPTVLHVSVALKLANLKIPFLLEKPVSNKLNDLDTLLETIAKNSVPVLVGFQLRYHPNLKAIQSLIEEGEIGKPLILHMYVGQYLPDWRSNLAYQSTSSASLDMGGGVVLDLCHSIDIACLIMGKVVDVTGIESKLSDLEIETEDVCGFLLRHEGGKVSQIHLNYIDREFAWKTRIVGSTGSLDWDYVKGSLTMMTSVKESSKWEVPADFKRDDLFIAQMQHMIEVASGKKAPEVSVEEGVIVTKIALAIKESSKLQRTVSL